MSDIILYMSEVVDKGESFNVGVVYFTGKNPPRGGKAPEGYQWISVKNRSGKVVGHKLEPFPDPEGPPNFTDEELRGTLSEPPSQGILSPEVMDRAARNWDGATKGTK